MKYTNTLIYEYVRLMLSEDNYDLKHNDEYINHIACTKRKEKLMNSEELYDELNTKKSIIDKAVDYENDDILRTPAQKRPPKHT